jgi:crossover junction endodeoxyribonuclease RuvC
VTQVLALDLSLTATGLAVADWDTLATRTITTGSQRGHQRLRTILTDIAATIGTYRPDLVVVEALFAGQHAQTTIALAELHGIVKFWLTPRVPLAVVETQHLKTYAVGRGGGAGTDKDAVLLAVERRYGALTTVANNNEADALVLAAMGLHHYDKPLVDVPKTHAAALCKVAGPALPGRPGHPTTPGAGAASETARLREHPARRMP